MKNWIIKFLSYLVRLLKGDFLVLHPNIVSMLDEAGRIVKALDSQPQSGEWKYHQAYARLLKQFPLCRRHQVGLAVTIAVQRRR